MKMLMVLFFIIVVTACTASYEVKEVASSKISSVQLASLDQRQVSGRVIINSEHVATFEGIKSQPIPLERGDNLAIGFVGSDNIYRVFEFIPLKGQQVETFGVALDYK